MLKGTLVKMYINLVRMHKYKKAKGNAYTFTTMSVSDCFNKRMFMTI